MYIATSIIYLMIEYSNMKEICNHAHTHRVGEKAVWLGDREGLGYNVGKTETINHKRN